MIKITTNITTHTTKLIGKNGNSTMLQWRAGSTQQEMKKSCVDAGCLFLGGGHHIDLDSGETIEKSQLKTQEGTAFTDPVYQGPEGEEVLKVDTCFSIFGTPYLSAYLTEVKNPDRGGLAGLKLALTQIPRNADRARGALVGNASTVMSESEMKQVDSAIRSAGLFHILYDHAWRQNPWVLKYATASCNHLADVRKAIDMGATTLSLVMPQNLINRYRGKKIGDHVMIQCPENVSPKMSCLNCGGKGAPLCDAQKRDKIIVLFAQHGSTSWKRSKTTTMKNISKASVKPESKPTTPKGIAIQKRLERVTLEKLHKAIKAGDKPAIARIGKRAIKAVSKATGKRYRAFLGMQ